MKLFANSLKSYHQNSNAIVSFVYWWARLLHQWRLGGGQPWSIYVYMERGRGQGQWWSLCICEYTYIYIYIYLHGPMPLLWSREWGVRSPSLLNSSCPTPGRASVGQKPIGWNFSRGCSHFCTLKNAPTNDIYIYIYIYIILCINTYTKMHIHVYIPQKIKKYTGLQTKTRVTNTETLL